MKKATLRIAVFFLATYKFAISQNDLERAKVELVKLRDEFAKDNSPGDILFLMDTTGSLTDWAFRIEMEFIENFLESITVTMEDIRVELIPFDSTASSYIDQVSNPTSAMNKCTFKEKLSRMQHNYGYGTNTKAAFQQAYDVCLGEKSGQKRSVKTVVILLTDGYWNYPWQDPNPIPIAQALRKANVDVFAIGIEWADWRLPQLVENPAKQAFFLKSFQQLDELSYYVRGGKWYNFSTEKAIR